MAGITLAQAIEHLENARNALNAAYEAQSYSIADRQVTRGDIQKLEASVTYWSRLVREKKNAAQGVKNPGFMTPKWT